MSRKRYMDKSDLLTVMRDRLRVIKTFELNARQTMDMMDTYVFMTADYGRLTKQDQAYIRGYWDALLSDLINSFTYKVCLGTDKDWLRPGDVPDEAIKKLHLISASRKGHFWPNSKRDRVWYIQGIYEPLVSDPDWREHLNPEQFDDPYVILRLRPE